MGHNIVTSMLITYLKLAAKIVCNHGDDGNANQCYGGELPGETDHEHQGSNKSHKVPGSEFESDTILCICSGTIEDIVLINYFRGVLLEGFHCSL